MQPQVVQALLRGIGVLTLVVALSGCPGLGPKPPAERAPDAQTAEKLVRQGDHRAAAQMFERLAAGAVAPAQAQYALRAAEQWLAAGEHGQAERVLNALGPALSPDQLRERTLLTAEVAIAANQPDRALQLLRELPAPSTPDASARLFDVHGRANFAAGNAVEGTRAFLARERWLQGADAIAANRVALADQLRAAAGRGVVLKAPSGADLLLAGWLEFGNVLNELERNPLGAAAKVKEWRTRYPLHPANSAVLDDALRASSVSLEYPAQIALLLPLSGRQQAAGTAVRDGFLSAYFQHELAQRPRVRVYDVAGETIASAYQRALADGAQFMVGPLTKDDVATAAGLVDGRVPMLALNFLAEGQSAPQGFFQFALSPEDEARQVARRVIADGRPRGVVLVPTGEWGTRVSSAFADELGVLGGELLARGVYNPEDSDYSPVILQLLRLSDSRERYARLTGVVGTKLEFEPRRRGDVQFIFVAAQPSQGRLIRPLLRFHYAGDVPMYTTSDAFEPDETANVDLDGAMFPDMPWMISTDAVSEELREAVRQAWPARANRRGRLYAFGFDSYRLIPLLRSGVRGTANAIGGATGRLTVDSEGRVRRELDWAQIRDGQPRILAITPPVSVSGQTSE
jgi:outer membrane PBP1 activator LpoA protein